MLIKYIKSVLWRVAKCLSYIEDARCLKVQWRILRDSNIKCTVFAFFFFYIPLVFNINIISLFFKKYFKFYFSFNSCNSGKLIPSTESLCAASTHFESKSQVCKNKTKCYVTESFKWKFMCSIILYWSLFFRHTYWLSWGFLFQYAWFMWCERNEW